MTTVVKDYYKKAREVVVKDFNGWLTKEEQAEWKRLWVEYVETNKPLTKEIFRDLPADVRKKLGPQIFGLSGGLWVNSGGAADDFWDGLFDKYADIAKVRSKEVRLANGWTINAQGHMTDPRGRTRGPNGQLFGPYAPVEIKASETVGVWEKYLRKPAP